MRGEGEALGSGTAEGREGSERSDERFGDRLVAPAPVDRAAPHRGTDGLSITRPEEHDDVGVERSITNGWDRISARAFAGPRAQLRFCTVRVMRYALCKSRKHAGMAVCMLRLFIDCKIYCFMSCFELLSEHADALGAHAVAGPGWLHNAFFGLLSNV